MVNEESVLQEAIDYLAAAFADDGVGVYPKSQNRPASFPCITLVVTSHRAVSGIRSEILAKVQIHATVYASNMYAPFGSNDGVHTIYDKLNRVMEKKHYARSNQSEPYYNAKFGKLNKDGYFTKITNTF